MPALSRAQWPKRQRSGHYGASAPVRGRPEGEPSPCRSLASLRCCAVQVTHSVLPQGLLRGRLYLAQDFCEAHSTKVALPPVLVITRDPWPLPRVFLLPNAKPALLWTTCQRPDCWSAEGGGGTPGTSHRTVRCLPPSSTHSRRVPQPGTRGEPDIRPGAWHHQWPSARCCMQ